MKAKNPYDVPTVPEFRKVKMPDRLAVETITSRPPPPSKRPPSILPGSNKKSLGEQAKDILKAYLADNGEKPEERDVKNALEILRTLPEARSYHSCFNLVSRVAKASSSEEIGLLTSKILKSLPPPPPKKPPSLFPLPQNKSLKEQAKDVLKAYLADNGEKPPEREVKNSLEVLRTLPKTERDDECFYLITRVARNDSSEGLSTIACDILSRY